MQRSREAGERSQRLASHRRPGRTEQSTVVGLDDIRKLIDAARLHAMTDVEREEQRRSFVHGNVALSNRHVTRGMVDEVADAAAKDGDA